MAGVNLFEGLGACSRHLTKFGGHAAAAGMSIGIAALDGFRAAFAAEAARQLGAVGPSGALAVDAEVTLGDLDIGFAEELARMGRSASRTANRCSLSAG